MNFRDCVFCLLVFIFPNYSTSEIVFNNEREKEAAKYIAYEDTSLILEEMKTYGKDYGETWFVIPDGNGTSQIAILSQNRTFTSPKSLFLAQYTLEDMPKFVKIHLYTKTNKDGRELNLKTFDGSGFNPQKKTKIICHGWMANSRSSVVTEIRNAYWDAQDVNIISVDWGHIAEDFYYPNAVYGTRFVGEYVSKFVDSFVKEMNASYEDFHVIGHSLGAHVAGYIGSNVAGKLGRLTGLDPALPGFQYLTDTHHRLDEDDADFVDVIHTCSGILGMSILVGNVDFYPNGGSPFQPGCCLGNFPVETQSCSHSRSHEFFAESIRDSTFYAVSCPDWEHFKNHKCHKLFSPMGEYVDLKARGPFYLKTHHNSPFGLGINGGQ